MTEPVAHLCFTLAAPYGAWGAASQSSATTAWKATELDPSRSALTGLLGAALGLERAHLGRLSEALRFAVRTGIRPTRDPQPDYHTISRAHRPEGREHWSRFEELRPALAGGKQEGALLSRREYWSLGLWTVAVATLDPAGVPLDRLEQALRTPRWPLYAGRKACTLGLPPDPGVLTGPGPLSVLLEYGWPWQRKPGLDRPLFLLRRAVEAAEAVQTLAVDEDYPGAPVADAATGALRALRRRDRPDPLPLPGGRIYQRFQERTELVATLPRPATTTGGAA